MRIPNLKIILGHFGETLPFLVWRIDTSLKRPGQKAMSFRDIFCKNFYVTTSGFFSDPGLDLLHAGDGRRSHPVCSRLAVCHELARGQVDGERLDLGFRQGEDIERQCQAAAEDVIRSG